MLGSEDRRQLVRIANLYYVEGWTQGQIAKKFDVSRPFICRLLQRAKDNGIVEVYIKEESIHTIEMEQQLKHKYRLKDAIVVSTDGLTPEIAKKAIGQAGAYYLSKNLGNTKQLGISWGTTLSELVKEYPFEQREKVNIVPLVGGIGTQHVEIHANQLAYELARKMNGTCSYLYAPAIVETKELKDYLVEIPDIALVLEQGKNVDLALISIGNPYAGSTMQALGYLQDDDLQQFHKMGVVGDIASRFFDWEGNMVNHPLNDKVIGLPLEQLKQIKNVIAVVEGTHKLESLFAALKGEYIDVLIIDEQSASKLIKEK
ncbi:DNA-binding transcriptional regulator LsrR (DeoR family) [Neobacillus niacini]|jgi:DNA-binding transcriptional regulator LsrR (DeoR family)|uniref:sugar-binding transcriptional regulator n=1 Tax=Neobacillus niacini TaxID=86668 RepID=UPI00278B97F8|nr:sugar-binding transcriptional regulator [Neobacillus niacini]MDQ1004433.1 DNA-binding transcriptional regulator LsrR (DeoR family) [Neobacillus niacini]